MDELTRERRRDRVVLILAGTLCILAVVLAGLICRWMHWPYAPMVCGALGALSPTFMRMARDRARRRSWSREPGAR